MLQLLEALPGVPDCIGYYFATVRGGWKRAAKALAAELKAWEQMARRGGKTLTPVTGTKRAAASGSAAGGAAAPKRARAAPAAWHTVVPRPGQSKADAKLEDDVAKVMDKLLTKVEKNLDTEVRRGHASVMQLLLVLALPMAVSVRHLAPCQRGPR